MTTLNHINHVEDLLLDFTSPLFDVPDLFLTSMIDRSNIQVQHKIDGSPAVIFGRHPDIRDNQLFVKTKHKGCPFFTSPEEIMSSHLADGLKRKLRWVLKSLPDDTKGIFQGDLLWTPEDDLPIVDGKACVKPNVVEYLTPISDALVGMCVHSKYDYVNETLEYIPGSIQHVPSSNYKLQLFDNNTNFSGDIYKTESNRIMFVNIRTTVGKIKQYVTPDMSTLYQQYEFHELLKRYINSVYRSQDDKIEHTNVRAFFAFVDDYYTKIVVQKYKTDKFKNQAREKMNATLEYISEHQIMFSAIFYMHQLMTTLKTNIIKYAEPMTGLEPRDGLGEGLVVHGDGYTVKLVHRDTFSRLNFKING